MTTLGHETHPRICDCRLPSPSFRSLLCRNRYPQIPRRRIPHCRNPYCESAVSRHRCPPRNPPATKAKRLFLLPFLIPDCVDHPCPKQMKLRRSIVGTMDCVLRRRLTTRLPFGHIRGIVAKSLWGGRAAGPVGAEQRGGQGAWQDNGFLYRDWMLTSTLFLSNVPLRCQDNRHSEMIRSSHYETVFHRNSSSALLKNIPEVNQVDCMRSSIGVSSVPKCGLRSVPLARARRLDPSLPANSAA